MTGKPSKFRILSNAAENRSIQVGETSEGLRQDDSRPKEIMPAIQDVAEYLDVTE